MRYVPYQELGDTPNVVVDGFGTDSTVLTLSHWPRSGTPAELKDDLSTQIVFRYLDRPDLHVDADVVSNNHYDEDGVCGIWALIEPEEALARRDLLSDVASAGDFGTFRSREAARISFVLDAYGDERSPLDLSGPYPEQSAVIHREVLGRMAEILDHPDRHRALWEREDGWLQESLDAIADGRVTIEEVPAVDLAVVTVPEGFEVHQAAVHNATRRFRILELAGRRYRLRYRYESWVVYMSEPVPPRVDLSPLAEELSAEEPGRLRWTFDGVDSITPSLRLGWTQESALAPEDFRARVEQFLGRAAL